MPTGTTDEKNTYILANESIKHVVIHHDQIGIISEMHDSLVQYLKKINQCN